MVDFAEGDAVARGHHEEFANLLDAVQFHCVHEGVLLCEKILHEIGEAEPGLAVGVTVGLEEEGVALEEAGDLAAAGESELSVELAGVIEAEDVLRLGGEELLGARDEAEEGVAVENALERGDAVGLGLDRGGSRAGLGLTFFLELFGGFGDEEGGGECGCVGGRVRV